MNKRTRLVVLAGLVLSAVAPLQGARESRRDGPRADVFRGIRKSPAVSANIGTQSNGPYFCGPRCPGCDVPHGDPGHSCHGTPSGNPRNRMP